MKFLSISYGHFLILKVNFLLCYLFPLSSIDLNGSSEVGVNDDSWDSVMVFSMELTAEKSIFFNIELYSEISLEEQIRNVCILNNISINSCIRVDTVAQKYLFDYYTGKNLEPTLPCDNKNGI